MEKGRENVEELKRGLTEELEKFVAATGRLLEPLKSLDEKQMAAVATLSYLMQGVIQAVPQVDITSRFGEELAAISPMLDTYAHVILACWDEHSAYATKMQECEEAKKKGDLTHPSCREASYWEGKALDCTAAQLEKLKGIIEELWRGLPEPPWPESEPIWPE